MMGVPARQTTPLSRGRRMIRFIRALRGGASAREAARLAGVNGTTPYKWRKEHPAFEKKWLEAEEAGTQRLEQVAYRMAAEGNVMLLIFLLKSRRPQVYRDIQPQVNVQTLGEVRVEVSFLDDYRFGDA